MKKFLFIILFISAESLCCTCSEPFYSNFKDASLHPVFENNFELIVQAKIISFSPDNYFMEIEIIEEIKDSVSLDRIIVSGQDGMNCALPLHTGLFEISDTVIFRLTNDFYNRQDTFELSDCSLNFLKYEMGYVRGNITNVDTIMSYQEFKFLFNNAIINSIGIRSEVNEFLLYPNPADQFLIIEHNSSIPINLYFYDFTGRLCKQVKSYTIGKINLSDLNAGVYIVKCPNCNEQQFQTRKIIIR